MRELCYECCFLNTIRNRNLCLIRFKLWDAVKKPEKSYHGGETVNRASRQRTTSLVTATLCIAIGVMAMLFVVYYANAINNQNQSSNQLASLQTQNSDLQNQIASRDSQISSLNTEVSSLSGQLNTLSAQNQGLQAQVNQLSQTVDALTSQLAQMEAAYGLGGGGAGRMPYMQ